MPKYDSSSQESSTSQLGGSISGQICQKFQQVVVKQRVHDGMRKKCYFIASPNFELVEINSTLSCKELSVNKFKRIFEDAKTDECLTDAVEAFEIVSTWN